MNFSQQLQVVKSLCLPKDQFVIVSSGSLAVRGIREARDIDIVVKPQLWNELKKKYSTKIKDGVEKLEVGNDIEILGKGSRFTNDLIVPLDEIFEQADVFDGINYINLEHLKKVKHIWAREKDLKDIELIDAYLNK